MSSAEHPQNSDERYMARALQLARNGLNSTHPNPRVGCVIVRDGEIVGEAWHERAGEPHAEVLALRVAGDKARGSTIYVTLEPCSHVGRTPPCANALIDAGVKTVVVAMRDPNPKVAGAGIQRLRDAGIEVRVGILRLQAEELNPGFISRMTRGRPWVRVKLAASLDGRTASAAGDSQWITQPPARDDVHVWRAQAAAIVTGIGTVLADDPSLTARRGSDLLPRQPIRVVLDTSLRMSAQARMLSLPGNTWVMHAPSVAGTLPGAELIAVATANNRIDLAQVLAELARREINDVWVEAGATLSGAFLDGGLVDELVLYFAPNLLGDRGAGMFALPGVQQLQDRKQLTLTDVRSVGEDLRIIARVNK